MRDDQYGINIQYAINFQREMIGMVYTVCDVDQLLMRNDQYGIKYSM